MLHGLKVKLVMSKTYDRVKWKKLGFCGRWINLIMQCINSVSYSILINGEPRRLLNLERGIY